MVPVAAHPDPPSHCSTQPEEARPPAAMEMVQMDDGGSTSPTSVCACCLELVVSQN